MKNLNSGIKMNGYNYRKKVLLMFSLQPGAETRNTRFMSKTKLKKMLMMSSILSINRKDTSISVDQLEKSLLPAEKLSKKSFPRKLESAWKKLMNLSLK
jgi:hypothetical protein